jgi:uncharacterized damage-inducible protein DinB
MHPEKIFNHWDQIRSDLVKTILKFEETDLRLEPFQGSWSVGRIMLHIADAEDGWLRYVVTGELKEWPDTYTLENYPDIPAILKLLEEVHSCTKMFLSGLREEDLGKVITAPWGGKFSLMWILWHIIEHEIHHRGELSLILGTLGKEGLEV